MSEQIIEMAKGDIAVGEQSLKDARDLIDRLSTAGEDTTELERKYRETETRLRRFKVAFG